MTRSVTGPPETPAAPARPARSERGRQTRGVIALAARELFAQRGYIETTIRAIAERAGVDPALVMQHFGTKNALFDEVADVAITLDEAMDGPADSLGDRVLRHALVDVEVRAERALPVLRSMLTHPDAAKAVRCAVIAPESSRWNHVLSGDDAALRAELIGTMVLGLLVARHLLRLPRVADAPAEQLVSLLGPCLRPLVTSGLPVEHDGETVELSRLADAETVRRQAAERVDESALAALAAGASYGEVGRRLGISRQAARKRWPGAAAD